MIKKFLSKAILATAIIGCIGGAGVMNVSAGNVSLDVTASNVSGMVSKDPYSKMVAKSDAEQNYYVKLKSLTNCSRIYFTAYSSAHEKVSSKWAYWKSDLSKTQKKSYDLQTALAGAKYYLYATAPSGYGNVRAIGTYCP